MYKPGTTLQLKELRSTEERPFPYDNVVVVGQSPIQYQETGVEGEWVGQQGTRVIIRPAGEEFGPTLDRPFGELQEIYDVVEVPPETPLTVTPERRVYDASDSSQAGLSPEEQFKQHEQKEQLRTKAAKAAKKVIDKGND